MNCCSKHNLLNYHSDISADIGERTEINMDMQMEQNRKNMWQISIQGEFSAITGMAATICNKA